MSAPHAQVAIRTAVPGDAAPIADLLRQLGYDMPPALVTANIEALAAGRHDAVLVATAGAHVVGSISLHVLPLFHVPGRLGRITSLVVDEGWRGAGIGAQLLGAAQDWFAAAGCVKIELTSRDERVDAHRFYARHGYARDGRRLAKRIG